MNNIFLHDQWITEEIEFNENESTIYQSLWETANSVLRGKFLAMNAYIKNIEKSQINYLMLHFKLLEKQEREKK
jgi:hypothetical protein